MKAKVEFNGDMDEYRAAVNTNMTDAPTPTIWDKIMRKIFGEETLLGMKISELDKAIADEKMKWDKIKENDKNTAAHVNSLQEENARLNNDLEETHDALETARTAMANLHGKVAAREVEYEDRIKDLERQIMGMRTIGKANDYDAEMKGIQL